MPDPQVLSSQEWDNAMLNGKNRMNADQAMLYNLVHIRKGIKFFVALAEIWIALTVFGIILVLLSN